MHETHTIYHTIRELTSQKMKSIENIGVRGENAVNPVITKQVTFLYTNTRTKTLCLDSYYVFPFKGGNKQFLFFYTVSILLSSYAFDFFLTQVFLLLTT